MDIVTLVKGLLNDLIKAEEKFYDDLTNFSKLETTVKKSTENFAAKFLGMVLDEINDSIYNDKLWRKGKFNVQRRDKRTLITTVGDVEFDAIYYKNLKDGSYSYLVEDVIGLDSHERFSLNAETELIKTALDDSYAKAAKSLNTSTEITKTTVMNKVHHIAEEYVKSEKKERKKCRFLYIDADEDHVSEQHGKSSLDNNSFLSKLIYVYEGKKISKESKTKNELINPVYFSGVYEGSENNGQFWNRVSDYIFETYDEDYLETIYINGDGGGWIKSGTNYVPKAKFCLDKFHLSKYIKAASNQLLDEKEIAEKEIYEYLYSHKRKQLLSYLRNIEGIVNSPNPVKDLISLLDNNWDAIMRTLHDKNVIGCSAEGHVSHILSDRLSSRPRAWSKTGADRISKLRCFSKNNGSEKIIDLVKYSREKRILKRTGTDDIEQVNVNSYKIIKDHYNSSKKYIDIFQARIPGSTTKKIFSIRNNIRI